MKTHIPTHIYIFTNSFPYKKDTESFLSTEMKVASQLEDIQLFLIPTKYDKHSREIPDNITIISDLYTCGIITKLMVFIKMLLNNRFWKMFTDKNHNISNLRSLYQGAKYFYGGCLIKYFLINYEDRIPANSILYSYWFVYSALGIAMAKLQSQRIQTCTCISRAHGYDIFGAIRDVFVPYQGFVLSQFDKVYSVSQSGADYLLLEYPEFNRKIDVSYLGIEGNARIVHTKKRNYDISFVSCAFMVSVKRLDLMFKTIEAFSLHHPQVNVSWTHIGNGELLEKMTTLVKSASQLKNLSIDLVGFKTPQQIKDIYSVQNFDVFLNFSLSEGLPVSIMEAISVGIPVIATNVGGTKEIVCQSTGLLLPIEFSQEEFEDAVNILMHNRDVLSNTCVEFFNHHFLAETNYRYFYQNIQSLNKHL